MFSVLCIFACSALLAEVVEEPMAYQHESTQLEGFIYYDNAVQGKRPGVMVVHEWTGLGGYAKRRARQLAELGYAAFAIDMYGKGVFAKSHQEAAQLAGMHFNDRKFMRGRVQAALDVFKKQKFVDAKKIGAIGYCFGGTAVLELARSGADVKGVVSFHGKLTTPFPEDAKNIKGKVLVCHGGADPHIPPEEVEAFKKEMKEGGVDLTFLSYPDAVHSFTVPTAGDDPSTGRAYNPEADKASWEAMEQLFKEVFNN